MEIKFQGKYENGNCFFDGVSNIPSGRIRVTVIFHDVVDKRQQKASAIREIVAEVLKAKSKLTDADWDDMAN